MQTCLMECVTTCNLSGMIAFMQTIMVYSESGGATKTTTAVSLAMTAALAGRRVLLIDLDPRAAATKWLGAAPKREGLHVGAILGNDDPTGWAHEIAVQSSWTPALRVIPSARSVSNREKDSTDHAELRLLLSLNGLEEDVVVLDCPNRQGGPLTLAALNAANTVVYAAAPTTDGIDGFEGARKSVQRFMDSRRVLRIPDELLPEEAGIVVGGVPTTVISRIASASIKELDATGMLLSPLVPHRTIVQEMRMTGEWYGNYTKGEPVAAAYQQLAERIIHD